MDKESWRRAIEESPEDWGLRQAYGDWLEGEGEMELAEGYRWMGRNKVCAMAFARAGDRSRKLTAGQFVFIPEDGKGDYYAFSDYQFRTMPMQFVDFGELWMLRPRRHESEEKLCELLGYMRRHGFSTESSNSVENV